MFSQIVEFADDPAIICRKCESQLKRALELKRMCETANLHFKRNLANEHFVWHENLRDLKATLHEEEQTKQADPVIEKRPPEEPAVTEPPITDIPEPSSERFDDCEFDEGIIESFFRETDAVLGGSTETMQTPTVELKPPAQSIPVKKNHENFESSCTEKERYSEPNDNEFEFINRLTLENIKEMTAMISTLLTPKEKSLTASSTPTTGKRKVEAKKPPKIKINLRSAVRMTRSRRNSLF